jgi:hypothetical protein
VDRGEEGERIETEGQLIVERRSKKRGAIRGAAEKKGKQKGGAAPSRSRFLAARDL